MPADPRPRSARAFHSHIGERIRYYRMQLGLNQADLARETGLNQGYLSQIERGRRLPSPGSIRALATALDLLPAVLIGPGPDHDSPQPLDTLELPLFGSIPAGPPARSQEQAENFPVLRHLWAPDRYCLRLTFDSMEPTLKPGDIVLVEYRRGVNPEHVQGKVCACLVKNAPTLKRVFVERRGRQRTIVLRGDNPDLVPLHIRDPDDLAIQGVVTHLVSRAM